MDRVRVPVVRLAHVAPQLDEHQLLRREQRVDDRKVLGRRGVGAVGALLGVVDEEVGEAEAVVDGRDRRRVGGDEEDRVVVVAVEPEGLLERDDRVLLVHALHDVVARVRVAARRAPVVLRDRDRLILRHQVAQVGVLEYHVDRQVRVEAGQALDRAVGVAVQVRVRLAGAVAGALARCALGAHHKVAREQVLVVAGRVGVAEERERLVGELHLAVEPHACRRDGAALWRALAVEELRGTERRRALGQVDGLARALAAHEAATSARDDVAVANRERHLHVDREVARRLRSNPHAAGAVREVRQPVHRRHSERTAPVVVGVDADGVVALDWVHQDAPRRVHPRVLDEGAVVVVNVRLEVGLPRVVLVGRHEPRHVERLGEHRVLLDGCEEHAPLADQLGSERIGAVEL